MTTTCPPGCGACCDPVTLSFHPDDMAGSSAAFAAEHWRVEQEHIEVPFTTRYSVRCDQFDSHYRTCRAYADRPPICADFPWYGLPPEKLRSLTDLPRVCAFHADVRTVLPIVAVTHGR